MDKKIIKAFLFAIIIITLIMFFVLSVSDNNKHIQKGKFVYSKEQSYEF